MMFLILKFVWKLKRRGKKIAFSEMGDSNGTNVGRSQLIQQVAATSGKRKSLNLEKSIGKTTDPGDKKVFNRKLLEAVFQEMVALSSNGEMNLPLIFWEFYNSRM